MTTCGAEPPFYSSSSPTGVNPAHNTWQLCEITRKANESRQTYNPSAPNPWDKLDMSTMPTYTPPTAMETFWHNYGAMVVLGIIGAALIIVIGIALIAANKRAKNAAPSVDIVTPVVYVGNTKPYGGKHD